MTRSTEADYLAVIDCGTTSIKAAIVRVPQNAIISLAQSNACPRGGESGVGSALATRASVINCLRQAFRKSALSPGRIAGIAITGQRASFLLLGANDEPLCDIIGWQDARGAELLSEFGRSLGKKYSAITGLPLHPIFSLGKLLWLSKLQKALVKKTSKFVLLCDYIANSLGTSAMKSSFVSDYSSLSLTGLFDITARDWSGELLEAASLRRSMLPDPVPAGFLAGALSGDVAKTTGLAKGTPILLAGGDQQCAGLGAGCLEEGTCSLTIGSAGVCFSALDSPRIDPDSSVMTTLHVAPDKWCMEAFQNTAASSWEWFKRILSISDLSDRLIQDILKTEPNENDVLFIPHLAGSASPDWNAKARASFSGMRLDTKRNDLLRAAMVGVSLENRRILNAFRKAGAPVREIRIGGGISGIREWNLLQANVLNVKVKTSATSQSTILGAAIVAAVGLDMYSDFKKAAKAMLGTDRANGATRAGKAGRPISPDKEQVKIYDALYAKYLSLIEAFGTLKVRMQERRVSIKISPIRVRRKGSL
jgi:xylulokinase